MTDIKMLPLPKWLLEGFTDPTIERLCDYIRAIVAHATAAKDAEIQKLQAELEIKKDQAEFYRITRNWNQQKARRLEEALQLALDSHGVMLMTDPPQDAWKARGVEAKARAALELQQGEQR